ncbi:MAG: hypothetical protein IT463_03740 [Planctomycetes bacterium]|nr:hypothetical protein [Planctomycetota bacterium]
MRYALLGLTLAAVLLAACSSTSVPEPHAAPEGAEAEAASLVLEQGRRTYEARCDRCHELYEPREYTRAQWTRAVKKYGPRSGLARKDYATVEAWLHAGAKDAK